MGASDEREFSGIRPAPMAGCGPYLIGTDAIGERSAERIDRQHQAMLGAATITGAFPTFTEVNTAGAVRPSKWCSAGPVADIDPVTERVAKLQKAYDSLQEQMDRLAKISFHSECEAEWYATICRDIAEAVGHTGDMHALFETVCNALGNARIAAADEAGSHPYNGPTRPVVDGEGNVTGREAAPDPTHEGFHRAVGDVLAGRIIQPAREQMERALADQKSKDATAPKPFRAVTTSGDPRRIGWRG